MTNSITCPSCKRILTLPESNREAPWICPVCQATVTPPAETDVRITPVPRAEPGTSAISATQKTPQMGALSDAKKGGERLGTGTITLAVLGIITYPLFVLLFWQQFIISAIGIISLWLLMLTAAYLSLGLQGRSWTGMLRDFIQVLASFSVLLWIIPVSLVFFWIVCKAVYRL